MAEGDSEPIQRISLLTRRERECLRLVLEIQSSKQIARRLGISQTSVDTHVRRARDKLGVRSRYDAARLLALWESGPSLISTIEAQPDPRASWPGQDWRRLWPLPSLASLNIAQRLLLIVGGAIAAAAAFGVLLSALAAL